MPKIIKVGDGTVYQYGNSKPKKWRWQLWVLEDSKNPSSPLKRITGSGFSSRTEARDALQEQRLRAKRQQPAQSESQTLQEFATDWLEIQSSYLAPSTIYGYRKILRNHIEPHLGHLSLETITRERVSKFYRELAASGRKDDKDPGGRLSANTVNKIHIVLQTIMKSALRDERIDVNPIPDAKSVGAPTAKRIKLERKEMVTWSIEELKWFLDWNKNSYKDDLNTLWELVAYTGLRRGEAVALKWKDIDFDKQNLKVVRAADPVMSKQTKTTKTGSARNLFLDEDIVKTLVEWKGTKRLLGPDFVLGESFVFGTLTNQLRTPNDVTARFSRTVKAARVANPTLPWLTIHGLRHTHATHLLASKTDGKVVKERLGHSNISTTVDIYQHVTPDIQKRAIESFAHWKREG